MSLTKLQYKIWGYYMCRMMKFFLSKNITIHDHHIQKCCILNMMRVSHEKYEGNECRRSAECYEINCDLGRIDDGMCEIRIEESGECVVMSTLEFPK